MNSIFRKTLLATILSATLSSVAMAADNYQQTMDSHAMDKAQLDVQQERSSKAQMNHHSTKTEDALPPCRDDMKKVEKSVKDGQKNYGSENRTITEHQGNVTDKDIDTASQLDKHDKENHGSENRPLSKHQDGVIEEEEEEEMMPQDNQDLSDEAETNSEINLPVIEDSSSETMTHDESSSHASDLYSMSADDLTGLDVVDKDGKQVGHVSSVVISSDQKDVHAVITIGSILGFGGRDILSSLDELTLVNDELHIEADKDQIAEMNDYGSQHLVKLEGASAISTAIRYQ